MPRSRASCLPVACTGRAHDETDWPSSRAAPQIVRPKGPTRTGNPSALSRSMVQNLKPGTAAPSLPHAPLRRGKRWNADHQDTQHNPQQRPASARRAQHHLSGRHARRGYRPAPGSGPVCVFPPVPGSTVEDEHFRDPDSPLTASAQGWEAYPTARRGSGEWRGPGSAARAHRREQGGPRWPLSRPCVAARPQRPEAAHGRGPAASCGVFIPRRGPGSKGSHRDAPGPSRAMFPAIPRSVPNTRGCRGSPRAPAPGVAEARKPG